MWPMPQAPAGDEEAEGAELGSPGLAGEREGAGLGQKLQEQFPDVHRAWIFKVGSCRGDAGRQEENFPLAVDGLQTQLLLQLHHTHGFAQVLG